jgi:hypothetical protein
MAPVNLNDGLERIVEFFEDYIPKHQNIIEYTSTKNKRPGRLKTWFDTYDYLGSMIGYDLFIGDTQFTYNAYNVDMAFSSFEDKKSFEEDFQKYIRDNFGKPEKEMKEKNVEGFKAYRHLAWKYHYYLNDNYLHILFVAPCYIGKDNYSPTETLAKRLSAIKIA